MSESTEFITIIRPSFMRFCQDACRAAALNHLLFRLAYKCKDESKEKIQAGEVMWYATTEQITSEMADAWGTCKVRKEVNALISMGLIGRSSNPRWGVDRTKHFFFGKKQCQKFLQFCEEHKICVVHLGLSPEVTHLIYISNANATSIKCLCEKPPEQMIDSSNGSIHVSDASIDSSNANDRSIGAIPKGTTKDTAKDTNKEREGTPSAEAQIHLSLSQDISDVCETPPAGEKETDLAEKRPVTPRVLPGGSSTETETEKGTAREEKILPSEYQCDPHDLQKAINSWRGYELEDPHDRQEEWEATLDLARKHTEGEIHTLHTHLVTSDRLYSQPLQRHRVGSVVLRKNTGLLLALREPGGNEARAAPVHPGSERPHATRSGLSTDIYTQAARDPVRQERNKQRMYNKIRAKGLVPVGQEA